MEGLGRIYIRSVKFCEVCLYASLVRWRNLPHAVNERDWNTFEPNTFCAVRRAAAEFKPTQV
jgi:hypothetical protein